MTLQPDDLTPALEKIADEVYQHCQYGEQSKNLPSGRLACGQFYGENVRDRSQRGLHGTAAAISILLATGTSDHVAVANKLLAYAKDRVTIENQGSGLDDMQIRDDNRNTIKQSELLIGTNPLVADSTYIEFLKQNLLDSQIPATGAWGYFYDIPETSEEATCYAVLALLKRVPYETIAKAIRYLYTAQSKLAEPAKADDINSIARRSLILFVLATVLSEEPNSKAQLKDLPSDIAVLWNRCQPKYLTSSEVSVEYYRGSKNHYLRIPWQVYLAYALLRVDSKHFFRVRFQKYLLTLHQSALNGGYVFENAGPYLSTRTNAVVFHFLRFATGSQPQQSLLLKLGDEFHEIWGKSWVRLLLIFLISSGIVWSSNHWRASFEQQSSLSVNLLASLIVTALAWLYGTGKKS